MNKWFVVVKNLDERDPVRSLQFTYLLEVDALLAFEDQEDKWASKSAPFEVELSLVEKDMEESTSYVRARTTIKKEVG